MDHMLKPFVPHGTTFLIAGALRGTVHSFYPFPRCQSRGSHLQEFKQEIIIICVLREACPLPHISTCHVHTLALADVFTGPSPSGVFSVVCAWLRCRLPPSARSRCVGGKWCTYRIRLLSNRIYLFSYFNVILV